MTKMQETTTIRSKIETNLRRMLTSYPLEAIDKIINDFKEIVELEAVLNLDAEIYDEYFEKDLNKFSDY